MTKPRKPSPETPSPEPIRVTAAKCARCGQPVHARFRPFCSQRCAEIDLGQWAAGTYRIPTGERPDGPEEPEN